HPAITGVPVFESWDETYVHTKHNPIDRTVLEVRRDAGRDEPWTWVRSYGKGRVFYTAWGHDQRTWSNPGFQRLVERGLRWTIGGAALTQVAVGPEPKTIELAVPLPTYKLPPAPWNTLDSALTRAQVALPTRESLKLMTLRPRFTVRPFATEPSIGNIIDFTWDARGRMWAVETQDYPNTVLPDSIPGHDRILILEDTNGDGLLDRVKVFADGLNLATSIAFANGGVVVAQAPHMLFYKDTNGDDKSDERKILFTGFPRNDTHGSISNLRYGFDNQVWGSVGYNGFRGTVGPSSYGRGEFGAGYFRFPGDGSNLEYVARTSNNTWGVALTEDNFVFGSTANSRPSNFVHIPLRYYRAMGARDTTLPDIADRLDIFPVTTILQVDQFGLYTAGAAHEVYTARAFPREYWNRTAFVAEPTGHVIGMFDLSDNGSGFTAKNRWSFMASRDAWAAPVQVKVGPDGAIWVSDFYTLVAQHNPTPKDLKGCCETGPGNAYETPNRDRLHGRIYRIAYDSARAAPPMRLDNATPQQLVRALTNDNMFWRLTAQRLLVERGKADVVPALIALTRNQTVDDLGLNPGALHALWTLQGLGAIPNNADALEAARNALYHPAASVRRAALMILPRNQQLLDDIFAAGILPDRGPPSASDYTVDPSLLEDADPHVRLEALLVLSELPGSAREAASILDMMTVRANARDPWIPDAIPMAAAKHSASLLRDLLRRPLPANDSIAALGIQRATRKLARFHAAKADPQTVVELISGVPQATPALAVALLDGIAEGWPQETMPELSAEQRATLVAAARNASPELADAFSRVAARWNLPNIFKAG
ncbi:MAG: PVC-type heme-binding CxxCH protein, partial [Gemmatimonadaceae bacterium]